MTEEDLSRLAFRPQAAFLLLWQVDAGCLRALFGEDITCLLSSGEIKYVWKDSEYQVLNQLLVFTGF